MEPQKEDPDPEPKLPYGFGLIGARARWCALFAVNGDARKSTQVVVVTEYGHRTTGLKLINEKI